mmetsp:Transcript_28032/g.42958  ORF Transcript_28032/g.42958 Transcript_28032/m.42958 type:complete len:363 (-) Transcript_28032:145-1233(-)
MMYTYPKLWQEEIHIKDGASKSKSPFTNLSSTKMSKELRPESEESFHWARSVPSTHLTSSGLVVFTSSTSSDKPVLVCLLGMIERSLVIAQEFALSTLFLVGHRCLVCRTRADTHMEFVCLPCSEDGPLLSALHLFIGTLLVIVLSAFLARRQNQEWKRQRNRDRLHNRSIDAVLIAGILRFLSSVLRTLTASYSSDTVTALAIGGMCLHVMTVDYNYANGISDKARLLFEGGNIDKLRPHFLGGTVSINCVFFSAALLASRLPSDADSYMFFMWTVVLFAYFPEARYMIAHMRIRALFSSMVMLGSSISAFLLLDVGLERYIFLIVQFCLLLVAPLWKVLLRKDKESISGPWDIAHLNVEE